MTGPLVVFNSYSEPVNVVKSNIVLENATSRGREITQHSEYFNIFTCVASCDRNLKSEATFDAIGLKSKYLRLRAAVSIRVLKALFNSSQKPTRKLAARTFTQSQYLKALAASLRVSFCDEWKSGLIVLRIIRKYYFVNNM